MNRLLFALCLGSLVVAGGCDSPSKQSYTSYTAPVPDDDPFTRGANRPPTAETLFRMAKLLETQGKDDQAYATLLNTIERYPDYVKAYCGLAELQVRLGQLETATTTLERALAISPEDPVITNDMGMCWMLRGDHEKALEYFTRASALAPNETRYKANMALATGMMGRYDEAYSLYEQIMRPARAHYNISVVAEARNDMAKADEEFAKASALDSTIERKPRSR